MTTANASLRALFVYAAIVPLALFIGYLLATPTEFFSWAPIVLVLSFLGLPLLLKWHRPLIFLTWNMTAVFFFMPGRPQVWLPLAFICFTIAILQRTLVRELRFIHAPSVVAPLLFMAIVVYVTARFTGGFGLQSFGSSSIGGRRYISMFAAIAGFLAMLAQPIHPQKAKLYIGLFFLGAIVDAIGNTINFIDPSFWYIYLIFPVEALPGQEGTGITRFFGASMALMGIYWYVLARYGARDLLSGKTLWRPMLVLALVGATMASGYRSYFILIALTFLLVFYFEGLLRTKYAAVMLFAFIVGASLIVPLADRLPLSIQRTLSVLPVNVSAKARLDAEASTEWRVQMWRVLWPEVPKYLWFGKGLIVDERDLTMAGVAARSGYDFQAAAAMAAGDYHSGPLTTIIPFGIWGVLALVWFMAASIRALYYNHLYGDEYLKKINTFLLAYFTARCIYFFAVFGNLHSDLPILTGIVGLGIALNGGIRKPVHVQSFVRPVTLRFGSPPIKPPVPGFSRS